MPPGEKELCGDGQPSKCEREQKATPQRGDGSTRDGGSRSPVQTVGLGRRLPIRSPRAGRRFAER
jgi:hypothetical protein